MWFSVGLLSLCVILAFQFRYRWHRPWLGEQASTTKGVRHRYTLLTYKDSVRGIQFGVDVPDFFRFELKRETAADRFFKWVGLSVEQQFGHDGFDSLVYVASNDQHLLNRVADSPALREAALKLFTRIAGGCPVRRVWCAHGQLVVQLRRPGLFSRKKDEHHLNLARTSALPFLEQMAKALRGSRQPDAPVGQRDPYLLPAVVLLSISTALAINGAVFLSRPLLFDNAFLVDTAPLVRLTLWAGSLLLLGLLAAHVLLLARSARAHLFLLELLLVGSFGAYSTAASELREANIEWDVSAPTLREAPVLRKSTSRSRRSGTSYHLHVRDWRDASVSRNIKVSRAFYESINPGRTLVFEERAGYFDAAWARLVGAKVQDPSSR
ncbi:hypothetical protein [Hydrogenophaga palleronii]|uniref:hypothetical protein n=1 Tax=Hydrogenophaga palleronii TaxID=65655 RepID=UPI000825F9FD|nr:hypothetical protein [Hydrogenophaga palleronii]